MIWRHVSSFVRNLPDSTRVIYAVVAALALAIMLTAGLIGMNLREGALAAARNDNRRLATVLAAQTERLLQAVDIVLSGIVRDAGLENVSTEDQFRTRISTRGWHDEFVSRLAGLPQAAWLSAVDADGNVASSSLAWPPPAFNVADRGYFAAMRQDGAPALGISGPTTSRANGIRMVLVMHRISAPDGHFLGMLTATLQLDYIDAFYAALGLPPGMRITLVRRDGLILTSFPGAGHVLLDSFPAGSEWHRTVAEGGGEYWGNGALDGLVRLVSTRPVGGFSVVVNVAITRAALFADWWTKLAGIGFIVAFAFAGLAVLLRVVLVQYGRLRIANQVLERSERRFRSLTATAQDGIITINGAGLVGEWNPAAERIFGYGAHEVIGRDVHEILAPAQTRARARRRLTGLPATGDGDTRGRTLELTALRKDGTEIAIELSLAHAQVGAERETFGIVRDITDRKRAERALAAANDALAEQALTDGLTGLVNRRHFDQVLEREWRRSCREALPLSLLLLDADCFKLYNDHYGHPMGDQVLRSIAASIQANIRRPADVGARYGGEEFAVILPNTQPDGAMGVAEAIRTAVAARRLPHEHGRTGFVTVSVGVASAVPTPGTSMASLIAEADHALYAAKWAGRNQTRLARAAGETVAPAADDGSAGAVGEQPSEVLDG